MDEPWISLILNGDKTWEMRKGVCKIRGLIALIRKGSGHIVGVAEITDCHPPLATLTAYAENVARHQVPPARQERAFADGWRTPWVLSNARPLQMPVPYRHPSGAVIWVNIEPDTTAKVEAQTQ